VNDYLLLEEAYDLGVTKTNESTLVEAKAALAGKPSLIELAARIARGSRTPEKPWRRWSARTVTVVDRR